MDTRGNRYLAMAKVTEAYWGPPKKYPKPHMTKTPDGQYDWEHWDDVRDTPECRHCQGTGIAPGDGATECGFCEDFEANRLEIERNLD